jgi:hypothetical protein
MMTAPSIGLCRALDDRRFFADAIRLSARQREPCEAIDAGARFVQLAWGRRSGKDLVQALIGLWHCLPREEFAEFIRRGELRRVLAFATTERQARELIGAAASIATHSPALSSLIQQTTDFEIRFRHGVVFTAMPCNARGDRGRGASCLLLNQFAHHFDGQPDSALSAETLFTAAVPSASQFAALRTIVVASTPAGDSNKFAQLRDEIVQEPSLSRAYFTGCTWEVNP